MNLEDSLEIMPLTDKTDSYMAKKQKKFALLNRLLAMQAAVREKHRKLKDEPTPDLDKSGGKLPWSTKETWCQHVRNCAECLKIGGNCQVGSSLFEAMNLG